MGARLLVDHRPLSIEGDQTLYAAAEAASLRIPTSCRGNGRCRECLLEIVEGAEALTPPTALEEHLGPGFRLACQARLADPDGAVDCRTLRRGEMRIVEDAVSRADYQLDPAVARRGDEVLLDGRRIDGWNGAVRGLALDLGTTTVVLRLHDLETGALVATSSFENPQRFGGSDVLARIQYDIDHPGGDLQRTLLAYLAHAIEELPGDPRTIYEIVVVGNPTLRDLFFGLDVRGIGLRPYRSITEHELERGERESTAVETTARRLRLPVHPEARVRSLPLVSGHVGADAAACLLAVDFASRTAPVAIIDLGTNTELLLGHGEDLHVASCPAGPAFEGGLISCGMPGLTGAIESVRIDAGGEISHRTIGDAPPEGLCGSGLVELLGELRRTERIDAYGRYTDDATAVVIDGERGIELTEADISELAQAKGANVSGLGILSSSSGIDLERIETFYLAGGFARHLDLDAARRIGLVPDLPDERFERIGNAALEGASIALLSVTRRRELEALVRRAHHVELETDPDFFDHFVEGCLFQPFGASETGEA